MEIEDLPDYVDVTLRPQDAIPYPLNGEICKTYQVRMYCFSAKSYLDTWGLRQRVMAANTALISKAPQIATAQTNSYVEEETDETSQTIDPAMFRMMMLMTDFDLRGALADFKRLVVGAKLVELDEDVYLTAERFDMVEGRAQEEMLMSYLANFIWPCALTSENFTKLNV